MRRYVYRVDYRSLPSFLLASTGAFIGDSEEKVEKDDLLPDALLES